MQRFVGNWITRVVFFTYITFKVCSALAIKIFLYFINSDSNNILIVIIACGKWKPSDVWGMVCMYPCMLVFLHVCIHVCSFLYKHVSCIYVYVFMDACTHFMYVYVWLHSVRVLIFLLATWKNVNENQISKNIQFAQMTLNLSIPGWCQTQQRFAMQISDSCELE